MRPRLLPILVLLALAGCIADTGPGDTPLVNGVEQPATLPGPMEPRGPVLAMGDSLMVGALEQGHFGAILTLGGWELETVAERGRSVEWAIGELEDRDERLPRHVVVVLGTNPGSSTDGFAEDVETLLDVLVKMGARRILWLPPYHTDPQRYAEKIAILREVDRAEPRLVVPDWGTVLDAHAEWVRSDGIHLTEDGYAAMAVFIRDLLTRLV